MRFSGFADEWNEDYLNKLFDNSNERNFESLEVLSVTINNGVLKRSDLGSDRKNKDKKSMKHVLKGDLVYNPMFMWKGASGISSYEGITSADYIVLKSKNNVNPIFFSHLFQTEKSLNKFKNYSQGSLLERLRLMYPQFSDIKMAFPSYEEQEKIANLLTFVDNKLELIEKKYQTYLDFKKYLMQQIFTQKLRFADCTGEWNLFKLGDIVELMRNGCSENQVSFETEFPVTRIETISKGILNFDKVGYVEKIDSSYLLQYGDILLSNINSLKYIGNCVFFDEDKPLYHGMNLMLMRFKDDFNKKYLFYYMKFYQQWFQKMACQAVNQASINQSSLKKFPFYIPPTIDEQNKIVNVIDDTEHKINSIEDQIIKMEEFKKGLLQQMFVVRINWRCNFKLVKSPSFNKHLLILKNKIIFIIIK